MVKVRYLFVLTLALLIACPVWGQDEEKAKKLFKDAIQAMGGDAYLNVKEIETEGNYFPYSRQGEMYGLIKFTDYTVLPDKSHFELGNKKKSRDIRVFNLETGQGWILEQPKELRAATPAEIKEFRTAIKHNLDNIFHFRWKDPANKLFYLGPGSGEDMMTEMVQILDPENDEVTVYFDRMSKLPAKIQYPSLGKNGVRERNVDEFSQWLMIDGVNTPLRVDAYVNGRQSYQIFATKITYNGSIPDVLFAKPELEK